MKIKFSKNRIKPAILFAFICIVFLFLFRDSFVEHSSIDYIMDEASESLVYSDVPVTTYNYVSLENSEQKDYLFWPINDKLRKVSLTMEYTGEAKDGDISVMIYNGEGEILGQDTIFLDHIVDVYTTGLTFKGTTPLANEGYLSVSFNSPMTGGEILIRSTVNMSYDSVKTGDIIGVIILIVICLLLLLFSVEIHKEWISIPFLTAAPMVTYLVFEYTTGNLLTITGINLVFNLVFFYCFYLVLFAITNHARLTVMLLNITLYLIAAAEYFVVLFRGRPIMLWDILAIQTAATVAGNYTYIISSRLIQSAFMLLALLLLLWKFPYKIKQKKKRVLVSCGFILMVIVYFQGFYSRLINKYNLTINMWAPAASYTTSGYVLSTFVYIDYLRVDKPEAYSIEEVERIQADIASWPEGGPGGVVPTNIICIMNESFSDLSVNGSFETNQDYLPFINNLTENTVKGNLYVPVFGSMTCNTEFEFLTGNSMSFLPPGGIAYQIYLHDTTWSLVSTLNALNYQTVAMHPYPGENWNRNNVFNYMGFDTFLEGDYFEDAERVRYYASDQATYDTIIDLVEEKEEGQPLFVFNVTMQNHGGYSGEYDNFETDVFLTEYSGFSQTEEYLSLIKISDQAFAYLLDYFSGIEEPTMIVMFGDHQPSVENEFYEALYGKPLSELTSEEQINQYITPFIIWTNYETEAEYIDKLSVSYLGSLVLEKANIAGTDYNKFIANMSMEFPVVHPLGYYNAENEFHTWENWKENPKYSLFRDFYNLQYNNLFDLRRRVDSIFTLS